MQMHGALSRLKIEMTMRNRTAWNTAALLAYAMAGKLPRYEEFFGTDTRQSQPPQTAEQQEVALRVLAAAWGAAKQE